MAQNISLLGANYSNVPAVQLPKTGGGMARFTDTSPTTATPADVVAPKVFFDANGDQQTGTGSSGGGGSSYTLLGSAELEVSTTSTTAGDAGTIACGSAAFTSAKMIYVRVRDKAGKRSGYFFGSDAFFINRNPYASSTTAFSSPLVCYMRNSSSSGLNATMATSGYGVWGYSISSNGTVTIRRRYNSNNTGTINGTFKCEVYALDWPDGVSPFS